MQNILKSTKYFIFLIIILSFLSCEKDDNNEYIYGTNSIVNYLEEHEDYSLFFKAVQIAEMDGVLDGNAGSYTILAPDNEAMEEYLSEEEIGDVENLSFEEALQLVNYHTLENLTTIEAFVTGYSPTLAEVPINDSVDANLTMYVENDIDEVEFNGYAAIEEGDIELDNGILHKIDHAVALPTIQTFMEVDESLQPFYEELIQGNNSTDFEELLADPDQRISIFIPDEFAVDEFLSGEANNLTDDELDVLYNYHLLDTLRLVQEIGTGYLPTKAKEDYTGIDYPLSLYVNTEESLTLNDSINLTTSDLVTVNGNIQVIDRVLSLPTLKTFVEADKRFESFYEMLSRDDLEDENYIDLLKAAATEQDMPLTVFAPDDNAFEALLDELFPPDEGGDDEEDEGDEEDEEDEEPGATLNMIDADLMTEILNMHIVPDESIRGSDFTDRNLTTLGDDIELKSDSTLVAPSGKESTINADNIQATNGMLHQVDSVLVND